MLLHPIESGEGAAAVVEAIIQERGEEVSMWTLRRRLRH